MFNKSPAKRRKKKTCVWLKVPVHVTGSVQMLNFHFSLMKSNKTMALDKMEETFRSWSLNKMEVVDLKPHQPFPLSADLNTNTSLVMFAAREPMFRMSLQLSVKLKSEQPSSENLFFLWIIQLVHTVITCHKLSPHITHTVPRLSPAGHF